jgi:hypothetical protein
MSKARTVTFEDEPLADGTLCRRYDDGRIEWRTHGPNNYATWRDQHGATGTDELLGDGVLKRTHHDGRVEYAREQGFGRTAWPSDILTVNRTSLGGRAGALLTALGAGTWMGALVPPPTSLSPEEEAELRRRAADTSSSGDTSSSSDGDLATHDAGHDQGDLGGDDSDSDFG